MSEKKVKKFKKENPKRDWTQERDLRCIPVAHEIFKIIANLEKLPINHDFLTKEEAYKIYSDINKAINAELSAKNIDVNKEGELDFIWQAVSEVASITRKLVTDSVERNQSILNDAIFDVKDGEPALYTAQKLAKMIEKKEEIREVIKNIVGE